MLRLAHSGQVQWNKQALEALFHVPITAGETIRNLARSAMRFQLWIRIIMSLYNPSSKFNPLCQTIFL